MKGNDTEAEYTIKQLARVFNISRSTLLYYESAGLIKPCRRGDNGYRFYRNRDVLNLLNALMLRNIGYGVGEVAQMQQAGDTLETEKISSYCDRIGERIEYLEAVKTVLLDYRERKQASFAEPFVIIDAPRYRYALSGSEQGWDKYVKTLTTDALLERMPLAGIGAVYDGCLLDDDPECHWARFVAENNLRFIEANESELKPIGGCKCLAIRGWCGESMHAEFDKEAACSFLQLTDYRPQGHAFVPCMFPRERFFMELYQPVVVR